MTAKEFLFLESRGVISGYSITCWDRLNPSFVQEECKEIEEKRSVCFVFANIFIVLAGIIFFALGSNYAPIEENILGRRYLAASGFILTAIVLALLVKHYKLSNKQILFGKDLDKFISVLVLSWREFPSKSGEFLMERAEKILVEKAQNCIRTQKIYGPNSPEEEFARIEFKKIHSICRKFLAIPSGWKKYFEQAQNEINTKNLDPIMSTIVPK